MKLSLFKDSDSVEKFNENKDEFYLPRFREIYIDAKRMIERLGIEANFHFTNVKQTRKPLAYCCFEKKKKR
ncbi:hypothetical protein [Helicobacter pylori]|uniref:hypothetical protein n=1 Tax=Helicobacter pylori TaxID=210 RepID=UPI001ABC9F79|nr:hypothetical protein [Helicobacter pylori]